VLALALREALSRSEQRALRSQFQLMVHILKWKTQPSRRTRSWVSTIVQARHAIEDIQLEIQQGFYREDLGLLSGTSDARGKS